MVTLEPAYQNNGVSASEGSHRYKVSDEAVPVSNYNQTAPTMVCVKYHGENYLSKQCCVYSNRGVIRPRCILQAGKC